ncbi:MAG: winged helix-turn-helix transcriptional regulator [Gemmatimonadales bacterium]|nr:winged helix-turn-helix transcriptional regulator [Gemmatimonadales bacterium]
MTATADPATMSQLHHALSDPTRLQIVERLRGGEQCVCELMDVLDAAQSRLSFHLRVLREAGLVLDRREGRWVYYALNRDALEEARDHLERLLEPARDPRGKCC